LLKILPFLSSLNFFNSGRQSLAAYRYSRTLIPSQYIFHIQSIQRDSWVQTIFLKWTPSLGQNRGYVKVNADWQKNEPGFLEMDLVAHCGESVAGFYLNTLCAVDVASGCSAMLTGRVEMTIVDF